MRASIQQQAHLSRMAYRRGKTYKAHLWQDFEEAEKVLRRSSTWRAWRINHPVADEPYPADK